MLQRGDSEKTLIGQGYLILVEMVEDGPTSPETVRMRLADSCAYLDGVGRIDVDYLGKIDVETNEDE